MANKHSLPLVKSIYETTGGYFAFIKIVSGEYMLEWEGGEGSLSSLQFLTISSICVSLPNTT